MEMKMTWMVLLACAAVGGARAAVVTNSQSYVQAGLCGQWDGLDNLKTGVRHDHTLVWGDLKGGVGRGLANANVVWMPTGWYNDQNGQPVKLGKAFSQVMNTRTFTIEFTVTPTRASTRETFLGAWHTGNWNFEHNSGSVTDGSPRFYFNANPDYYARNATVTNGETAVIALVATPSGFSVYKNGVLADTSTVAFTAPAAGVETIVGGEFERSYMAFHGTYHALRLYNTALTAADVAANAAVDRERYCASRHRLDADGDDAYLVRLAAAPGTYTLDGKAAASEQWVKAGTSLALAFTPASGVTFTRWAGDVHAIPSASQTAASVTLTVNGPVDLAPVVARTAYRFTGPNNATSATATWATAAGAAEADFTSGNGIFQFDGSKNSFGNFNLAANAALEMYGISWSRTWGSFIFAEVSQAKACVRLGAGGMTTPNDNSPAYYMRAQVELTADQTWSIPQNPPLYVEGGVRGDYTLTFAGAGKKTVGGAYGSIREYNWPRSIFAEGQTTFARTDILAPGHELVFAGGTLNLGACNQTVTNGVITEMAPTETPATITSDGVSTRVQLTLAGDVADAGFGGRLTQGAGLAWVPAQAARVFTFSTSVSDTQGRLTVSNGTLRVAAGAGFSSLSEIRADGAGAVFELAADAGTVDSAALTVAHGAKVRVAAGRRILADAVTVDGVTLAAGTYTSASWLDGEGSVIVAGGAWQGAGADTYVSTDGNWSGTPDLTGGAFTAIFAVGGTAATLAADQAVNLRGVQFNGTRAFTLAAEEGASATLGAAGLSTADGAYRYTNAWPIVLGAAQTWSVGANADLTVSGGIASGADATQALLLDGAGTLRLTGESTFSNPITFNKGTYYVQGTNALGTGTTAVHLVPKNAAVHFLGGRETRPITLDNSSGSSYEDVFVDAGELHLDGKLTFVGAKDLYIRKGATLYCHAGFQTGGCHNHNGPGTLVIDTVPMVQADRFYVGDSITIELRVAGNKINGNAGSLNSGTVKTCVPYAITNTVGGTYQRLNMTGGGATLDLCGNDQAIGVLGCAANTKITSAQPAFLHLVDSYDNTEGEIGAKRQTNSCCFAGCACLSKEGSKNYWLRGASTSTGTVQVTRGTLTFESTASWANSTNAVASGTGTLKIQNAKAFGPQVTLSVDSTAKLDLDYAGTMACALLYLDGARARFGKTYGAAGSGADVESALITGTGLLYVRGNRHGATIVVR